MWREPLGDYVHVYVEANGATYGDTGAKHTLYYGPLAKLREHVVGGPFTIIS